MRYLQQRKLGWYAVMEVPKNLRSTLGRRRVQSLKTQSRSEAERRVHGVVAAWLAEFETVSQAAKAGATFTDAQLATWKRERAQLTDEALATYDEDLEFVIEEQRSRNPQNAAMLSAVVGGASAPLAEHVEPWLSASDNTAKTKDMKRADIQELLTAFRFSHEVNRTEVQALLRAIQKRRSLSDKTAQRICSAWKSFWDYLIDEGHVAQGTHPFLELVRRKARSSKALRETQRQAFSDADVVRLLHAAADEDDKQLCELIWWGMWTGCRIEELASLRVAEVESDRFTVSDAKTDAGHRVIPIHSALEPVCRWMMANSRDGFVISGLSTNKYGDRSNAVGKRFGRLRTKLGFGSQVVFHSIRKTVSTQLQNADVSEVTSANLLGHKVQSMTYGVYSAGAHFRTLKAAIEKLSYPVDGPPSLIMPKG